MGDLFNLPVWADLALHVLTVYCAARLILVDFGVVPPLVVRWRS